jgi:hypothetical protein
MGTERFAAERCDLRASSVLGDGRIESRERTCLPDINKRMLNDGLCGGLGGDQKGAQA